MIVTKLYSIARNFELPIPAEELALYQTLMPSFQHLKVWTPSLFGYLSVSLVCLSVCLSVCLTYPVCSGIVWSGLSVFLYRCLSVVSTCLFYAVCLSGLSGLSGFVWFVCVSFKRSICFGL